MEKKAFEFYLQMAKTNKQTNNKQEFKRRVLSIIPNARF
jgi:hypothetical protein